MGRIPHTTCWAHCWGWLTPHGQHPRSCFFTLAPQEHPWKMLFSSGQVSHATSLGVWKLVFSVLSWSGTLMTSCKSLPLSVPDSSLAAQRGCTKSGSLQMVSPRVLGIFTNRLQLPSGGWEDGNDGTLSPLSLLGWEPFFFYLCWHSKRLFKGFFWRKSYAVENILRIDAIF